MRFASFVGVIAGDLFPDGDMDSNILERSRTGFDGVPEGVTYVLRFIGVDDSSTNSTSVSVSTSFSVLRGDGARITGSSESFLRFELVCSSKDLTLGLLPYVRIVPDDAGI